MKWLVGWFRVLLRQSFVFDLGANDGLVTIEQDSLTTVLLRNSTGTRVVEKLIYFPISVLPVNLLLTVNIPSFCLKN